MNLELIPGNHSLKEFQLRNVQFSAHHKKSVKMNENQSTSIKKIKTIFWGKSNHGLWLRRDLTKHEKLSE